MTGESSNVGSMFGKARFIIHGGIVTPAVVCLLKGRDRHPTGKLEWASVEAHVRTNWRTHTVSITLM